MIINGIAQQIYPFPGFPRMYPRLTQPGLGVRWHGLSSRGTCRCGFAMHVGMHVGRVEA